MPSSPAAPLCLAALLAGAGCAAPPLAPAVRPSGVVVLTSAQAEQLGVAPATEAGSAPGASAPQVMIHRLGPRVDGRDPTLLHGPTEVYRLVPSRWHPAAGYSGRVNDQRGEAVPLLPAEFEAWRLDQQRLLARQQEAVAALGQAVAELQQALQRLAAEEGEPVRSPATGGEP